MLIGGANDGAWKLGVGTFQEMLRQLGWVENGNVEFNVRSGENDTVRITAQVKDLLEWRPDVVFVGPTVGVIPLIKATSTTPVVFVQVTDPVGRGVVKSLSRPGGNVTGFSNLEFSLMGKWLQFLKEIAPHLTQVVLMISVANPNSAGWFREFERVTPSFAIEPISAPIRERAEIDNTMEKVAQKQNCGLIVPGDSFLGNPSVRQALVTTAASRRIPAVYGTDDFVKDGGLMSYGVDLLEPFRQAAVYVDRILKGEAPANLPVQEPSKFVFSVNLSAARAIGVTIPKTLLVAADEVIE